MQICDAQVEGGCVVLALEDSRVEAIYSFGWHRAGFSRPCLVVWSGCARRGGEWGRVSAGEGRESIQPRSSESHTCLCVRHTLDLAVGASCAGGRSPIAWHEDELMIDVRGNARATGPLPPSHRQCGAQQPTAWVALATHTSRGTGRVPSVGGTMMMIVVCVASAATLVAATSTHTCPARLLEYTAQSAGVLGLPRGPKESHEWGERSEGGGVRAWAKGEGIGRVREAEPRERGVSGGRRRAVQGPSAEACRARAQRGGQA